MHPVIAVAAHNRPHALSRLLTSLSRASYSSDVPLVISIDPGGVRQKAVEQTAAAFEWTHGEKRILHHPEPLGLVEHIFALGDLADEYRAVIRLEDDHVVSRAFYVYAQRALDAYQHDGRIAGISLYSLWFHGYTRLPFVPYPDQGDVFFLRVPWSHGQAYTRRMWADFRTWLAANDSEVRPDDPIHEVFTTFDHEDWFPAATKYLALTGRYYVFPRHSFVTNWGDAGTHFSDSTGFFQVPLQHHQRDWAFTLLDDCLAVYDSFMEMVPERLNRLTDRLAEVEFCADLYASRSAAKVSTPYVLTTRRSRRPLHTWGRTMWPIEANIAHDVPGTGITLTHRDDIKNSTLDRLLVEQENHAYFSREHNVGMRRRLLYRFVGWLRRWLLH